MGKEPGRRVGLPRELLRGDMGRGWSLGDEDQVEVVDDTVDHAVIGEESDDLHPAAAFRTDHGFDFVDLPDHFGPAFGRETTKLLLDGPERQMRQARLPDLPPLGVRVQAVVPYRDLALIGDMLRHPGDEFQIIHLLELGTLLAVSVANLAIGFQKRQAIQGQDRPDHVLPRSLSFRLRLGPDQAVDVEAAVPPGENPPGPLQSQQSSVHKKLEHLTGEERGQPVVVDAGDLVEDAGLVHSALGHQEMEGGMEIYPGSKFLDGGDHSGHQLSLGHNFKITDERAESRAAEIPQQPAVVLEEYPEHPGDGEDDLAVGDIQEKLLPHPPAPLLQELRMT